MAAAVTAITSTAGQALGWQQQQPGSSSSSGSNHGSRVTNVHPGTGPTRCRLGGLLLLRLLLLPSLLMLLLPRS
jgi:hypothetical protein